MNIQNLQEKMKNKRFILFVIPIISLLFILQYSSSQTTDDEIIQNTLETVSQATQQIANSTANIDNSTESAVQKMWKPISNKMIKYVEENLGLDSTMSYLDKVETINKIYTDPEEWREVKVIQELGNIVYWILPGPTKLDEQVFGTPEFPMNTGEYKISKAKGAVKELFEKFPIMAGVPLTMRETNENGTKFTQTNKPTPVSNSANIVNGSFEIIYKDYQPYDLPGDPTKTLDKVSLNTSFTDPIGNQYEIKVKRLYQPPFPGFESGGGVITNAFIHGNTGIDSPLFPTIFTYGTFWGIGDIIVNGKTVDEDKWIHVMTTQNVRDQSYNFTTSEGLPLMPEETFSGQIHHTHVIVRPIKITSEGPKFDPVKTEFTLPNGMRQPFIHIMFEQDKIVSDVFKDWKPEVPKTLNKTSERPDNAIVIEAKEFSFTPKQISLQKGDNVNIFFKNVGTVTHSFELDELDIKIDPIQPGQSKTIKFKADQRGSFHFKCGVTGHAAADMTGILNVL